MAVEAIEIEIWYMFLNKQLLRRWLFSLRLQELLFNKKIHRFSTFYQKQQVRIVRVPYESRTSPVRVPYESRTSGVKYEQWV